MMTEPRMAPIEHPGGAIKAELDVRAWTQRDLAYVLGMTEQQLSPMLNGKRGISPDMARMLGDAFDVPADFFANLQKQYDLSRAKAPDPNVRRRAVLQQNYPLRDMIKRGWLEDTDAALLELQLARFFEVKKLSESPRLAHAARKSNYEATPPAAQLAWLFRVRQIARTIKLPAYSEDGLRGQLPRLHSMVIDPEEVKHVPKILAGCGVRFIVVEALPTAKIDGVCFWSEGAPVIGMSTRFDRMDNFWFVLRHEIEHILRGDGKDAAIFDDLETTDPNATTEERAANEAASEFCVPKAKLSSFCARKGPYISDRDIVGFAGVLGVHPALVVGQLHHRLKKYNAWRKYLVPIRKHLLDDEAASAMVDGWGRPARVSL